MKEIGGFFELELPQGNEYHKNAIRLNYARNALEYILIANKYSHIYLPLYICNSVLEPINKLKIPFTQYKIDNNFNPIFNFDNIEANSLFIYVNYFGICNSCVESIVSKSKYYNFYLCIDNTQAFFNLPLLEEHTIYSARKFFGVPDGAYLYTNTYLNYTLENEVTYNTSNYLLKRIDLGANNSYIDFQESSLRHKNQDIKNMSNLSRRILNSIDYKKAKNRRNENFLFLHNNLNQYNTINFDLTKLNCPMIYPLLNKNFINLRKYFIDKKIFIAKYWPEISKNFLLNDFEYELTNYLFPLPIDQRYSINDMKYILKVFNNYLKDDCLC